MTKEGKVIVGEKLSDPSDLIAVMFSPDRVKIVDLETGIGCVYQRQKE